MNGFLLVVILTGFPHFVLPMPDNKTCAVNAEAMDFILAKDKSVKVFCFDVAHQAVSFAPSLDEPQGERVE